MKSWGNTAPTPASSRVPMTVHRRAVATGIKATMVIRVRSMGGVPRLVSSRGGTRADKVDSGPFRGRGSGWAERENGAAVEGARVIEARIKFDEWKG